MQTGRQRQAGTHADREAGHTRRHRQAGRQTHRQADTGMQAGRDRQGGRHRYKFGHREARRPADTDR